MKTTISCFLLLVSSIVSANSLDSVLLSLAALPDSNKVDSMIRLSRMRNINGEEQLGFQYAKWALATAKEKSYKDLIPKARFYIASSLDDLGKADSAIYHYTIALQEAKGTATESWKKYIYDNIGYLYRQIGSYEKALNYQLKGLKIVEGQKDSFYMGKFFTNIGYTYDRMKEYEKAIEWHNKSLQILPSSEEYFIFFVYSRIAIAYDDLGKYDSAHYYNQETLSYYERIGDTLQIGITCSNIGNSYIKEERWDKAVEYLNRAVSINLKYGDPGHKSISLINLGTAQMNIGEFESSKRNLRQGLIYAREWQGLKFQSEANEKLYQLFEIQQKYDSALYYFRRHEALEDSLYGIEKQRQIEELSTIYETEKKEQQLKVQKASLSEKESQLKARQITIIALIVFSVLIIVLAIGLYRRYKAKKNAELQQRIIEEQEKGLKAVFNAQEQERKRISKDLHDGVGQQLSGLKMAFQKLGVAIKNKLPEEKEEVEKLAQIVSESADEVRSISHQMMPRTLLELGLIEAIIDMLEKSLGVSGITYEFEHYGIQERLAEQKEVSLYRISQELVNNIIKHSGATEVSIQLFKNADKIILIVEDNGKGLKNNSGKGHGLMNIKSRLNTLNGEVNFEPSPTSGTLATVRIPI